MNYVVGIGGTGARCVEALIHLCAMGLGPDKLGIIFIDPDNGNGNVTNAQAVFNNYNRLQSFIGKANIFETELSCPEVDGKKELLWTLEVEGKNLKEIFSYNLSSPEMQKLCSLFYSEEELNEKLDHGFLGRPSMGSSVIAQAATGSKIWKGFISEIEKSISSGQTTNVFVFSSIFGGTGASGFPTIGKILKEHQWMDTSKFKLGGCLLFPYFGYKIEKEEEREKLYADPDKFLIKSKIALEYYNDYIWKTTNPPYNAMWLIGHDSIDYEGRPFHTGGSAQKNPPDFVELIAGLSSIRFFKEDISAIEGLARARKENVYWSDLSNQEDIKKKILSFITFAKAFLNFYLPFIKEDKTFKENLKLAPWIIDGKMKSLSNVEERNKQEDFESYLKNQYLLWLTKTFFGSEGLKAKLLTIIEETKDNKKKEYYIPNEIEKILFYDKDDTECAVKTQIDFPYNYLWDAMCEKGYKNEELDRIDSSTGRLLNLLYKCCKDFCEKNYGLRR